MSGNMMNNFRIGVLALQGDVEPHLAALTKLGVEGVLIRRPYELDSISGLLLPGGESTTMTKLLAYSGLDLAIPEVVKNRNLPIWGTCAGCILLARQGLDSRVKSFELLDIEVARNAYGTQTDSFTANVNLSLTNEVVPGVFIRAPRILSVGSEVTVAGKLGDQIVHVEEGNRWASTFHPELSDDTRLHARFCELARG